MHSPLNVKFFAMVELRERNYYMWAIYKLFTIIKTILSRSYGLKVFLY